MGLFHTLVGEIKCTSVAYACIVHNRLRTLKCVISVLYLYYPLDDSSEFFFYKSRAWKCKPINSVCCGQKCFLFFTFYQQLCQAGCVSVGYTLSYNYTAVLSCASSSSSLCIHTSTPSYSKTSASSECTAIISE